MSTWTKVDLMAWLSAPRLVCRIVRWERSLEQWRHVREEWSISVEDSKFLKLVQDKAEVI
jgi:hypothetical protein